MMMSYEDAIAFINPAYNPNVASFFPQPLLISSTPSTVDSSVTSSSERSLAVAPERVDDNYTTNQQPREVELLKNKSAAEALRCEICSISCNSKKVLEDHVLGKKHRKKIEEQTDTLKLDSMKTDECMDNGEIESIKNVGSDASLPGSGLEEMCAHPPLISSSPPPHLPITGSPVTSSNERSLAMASESFNVSNDPNQQPREVERLKKKSSTEILRCEVCSISCNSKMVLEAHVLEMKHRKKTEEQNSDTLKLDSMKTDECMENGEIESIENIGSDASLPGTGLEEMWGLPRLISSSPPPPLLITNSPVTSSNERSLAMAPESFNVSNNPNHQPREVERLKKKSSTETLRCEVCSISCNSKRVLEVHILGKKHRKKTGEQNPDNLMLDSMKTDEYIEGEEIGSIKNIDSDASLPRTGLEEMCALPPLISSSPPLPLPITNSPVTSSNEISLAMASESFNVSNDPNQQPREVERLKKKSSTETLRCEVCSIGCNSKKVFEVHILGKKHRKKTGEQNPDNLMLDSMKTDEYIEGEEIESIKMPGTGLEETCTLPPLISSSPPPPLLVLDSSVTSSNERSLAVATESFNSSNNTNQQPREVELIKKRSSTEALRCEVCSISCNSKKVFEVHILGNKHRKKTGEQNPDNLMLDSMKTDESMEGEEIKSDASLPGTGLDEMSAHPLLISSTPPLPVADSSVTSSNRISLVVAPVRVNVNNATNQQPREVELLKKKSATEAVRCEICSIGCNSQKMLEKHILGKSHIKKKGEQNPDTVMLDSVKTDEYMEGAEKESVKNTDSDAQPLLISSSPPLPILDSSVTSSNKRSLAVTPGSFNVDNSNQQLHAIEDSKKKSVEALRCEICKKHKKKTGEKSPDTLMMDRVKTDEYMEGAEIEWVKNTDSDASLPGAGLKEMCAASGISCETQAMLEPLNRCSHDVPETCSLKHQGVDNDGDEIIADKRQSNQLKADCSEDLSRFNCASGPSVGVCTVCNIFSNSQLALEKHLAGKTHARKVRYLRTLMSCPVSVYDIESNTSKLTSNTISGADLSSFIPVGCTEIKEITTSEGGTLNSSPKACIISNIKCSTQEIFGSHICGRKHASKVRMLGSSVHTPYHSNSTKDHGATERASKRGKIVQFAYCDVCKIYCNSSELLDAHTTGRKHMKQLEKLVK